MLRTLTTIGLLIAIALPLIDIALFRPNRKSLGPCRAPKIEKLIYFLFLLAIGLQGLSSFGMILAGERMHHWMLQLHMSVAGLFAVCITALALLWAEQATFNRPGDQKFHTGEKFAFWATVLMGFATITSAMMAMMGWFASPTQIIMLRVHRYSALLLLIAAIFQGYRLIAGRPAQSSGATPAAAQ